MINGIQIPQSYKYSSAALMNAKISADYLRNNIDLDDSKEYKGTRFYDQEALTDRLQSWISEEDFMKDSLKYVEEGLKDCANSDYYYTYEKDWGSNEIEIEDE